MSLFATECGNCLETSNNMFTSDEISALLESVDEWEIPYPGFLEVPMLSRNEISILTHMVSR